jgi:hypothetical protein
MGEGFVRMPDQACIAQRLGLIDAFGLQKKGCQLGRQGLIRFHPGKPALQLRNGTVDLSLAGIQSGQFDVTDCRPR